MPKSKKRVESPYGKAPKSKEEVAQFQKQVAEAKDRRQKVREKLWPLVQAMKEDVRYSKIFLYTASVGVETAFNNKRAEAKVKDLDMLKMFDVSDPKTANYKELYEMFAEESVDSFLKMVKELPDFIDNYLFHKFEKDNIDTININEILIDD